MTVAPFALLGAHGHAGESGWLRSTMEQSAIDRQGRPIPWMTYPAIHFLADRLHGDLRLFEYGCGQSTLWFAHRVATVVACEHEPEWAARVRDRAPANVRILDVPLDDGYADAPRQTGERFDIIVIDGRRRADCAAVAAGTGVLTDAGILVWDDTERPRYRPGIDELLSRGFRQLPFHGLGPILAYGFETSVFYRPDNCLGI